MFSHESLSQLGLAFLVGLRYDLTVTAWLSAPFWLLYFVFPLAWVRHTWGLSIAFVLLHIPFLALNSVDIILSSFISKRTTAGSLYLFSELQGRSVGILGPYFLPMLFQVILVSALIFLILWWAKKRPTFSYPFNWAKQIGLSFLVLALLVVFSRGGFQLKPIAFAQAQVFTQPVLNNLPQNSTFTLLKTWGVSRIPRYHFFSGPQEYEKHLNWRPETPRAPWAEKILFAKKPNIVLIVLEGIGNEYMGKINGDKGYTPFLDELAEKSLFFTNAYANGRRSIEGVGSILSGIPALMDEPFISSEFATNEFLGLGNFLEQRGYETSFFHGAQNGTMYFDTFTKSAGIHKYYGLHEYGGHESPDFDGTWGIYDGPYLQYFAKNLNQMKKPFFAGIFTLTSHQPFTLPPTMRGKFAKGPIEGLEAAQYVDYSLKEFFATVEKSPIYDNTLFIITADHTGIAYRDTYEGEVGRYRVPLLFYMKNAPWTPQKIGDVAQHIDVIPTLLDMLGDTKTPCIKLSQSLLRPHNDKFFVAYFEGQYLFVNHDYFATSVSGSELEVYGISDRYKEARVRDQSTILSVENHFKAALQYYSDGLWDRSLYFPAANGN